MKEKELEVYGTDRALIGKIYKEKLSKGYHMRLEIHGRVIATANIEEEGNLDKIRVYDREKKLMGKVDIKNVMGRHIPYVR